MGCFYPISFQYNYYLAFSRIPSAFLISLLWLILYSQQTECIHKGNMEIRQKSKSTYVKQYPYCSYTIYNASTTQKLAIFRQLRLSWTRVKVKGSKITGTHVMLLEEILIWPEGKRHNLMIIMSGRLPVQVDHHPPQTKITSVSSKYSNDTQTCFYKQ